MRNETDWLKLWVEDKKSIIQTMGNNMEADIDAGYDPFGENIKKQTREIYEYTTEVNKRLRIFDKMDKAEVDKWCYNDLLERGAIA